MNVAINFHALGRALKRDAAALRRHARRRAERLFSKRSSARGRAPSARKSKPNTFDDVSHRETIRRAQQGDSAAFEIIYQLYARRVYALCLRMLHHPVEAEDAVQDAFMQLFRKIHTFRGESAFSTWLHRLTANVVLMRLRRKKPITVSIDELVESDDAYGEPLYEIGGPDLRLSGLVDRVTLQAAVEELAEGYREVFVLYDVHGYEHSEIAKILRRSIGNSKSQLHKVRKRLRELLQSA